jgi:N-acetylmuramoyl-L-alanine amidase
MTPASLLLPLLASLVGAAAPAPGKGGAPLVIVVQSARGEVRVPVQDDPDLGAAVPAAVFMSAVGGAYSVENGWAAVSVGGRTFRFLLGARVYETGGTLRPLAGGAAFRRDTLILPLQFVTEILPRTFVQRFRYDRKQARLTDNAPATVAAAARSPAKDPERLPNGLRRGHVVTVDAGHGGPDPGNPGLYFPRGVAEKHVNLAVSLLLRDELEARGVGVVMTRTKDTLIDLRHRGSYCTAMCDLFVSIHVNSLPRRAGFNRVSGFETYFLAEAKTEDAARVARMENEAIRFESTDDDRPAGGLDFILRDLQLNEYLRESARAAELVQSYMQEAHSGPDRGVKQAGLMVLTTARRPAILVELGYSTNRADAKLMSTRATQKNLASSIADAVVAYLREYERKIGGPGPRVVGDRAGNR